MKAVVLAGGFGTRITPLTYSLPKPMLPLAGKPILEHVIELLKVHGFDDLIVLLYFQPNVIKEYFGDGGGFGVNISYVLPSEDYGTAGAVKVAQDLLPQDEPFLVISGDLLADVDLTGLVEFHRDKDAVVTIGLTSVTDPLQFGIVITDNHGRVAKFLEKPGWGEVFSDSINAGVYVIEPAVLEHIPKRKSFDFSHDLFTRLLDEEMPLYGYLLSGYWRDVGDTTSYWCANADILAGKVRVKGTGERLDIVGKNIWLGRGVDIAGDAELAGTIIVGDGVRINGGAYVKDSILGADCFVGERSRVEDSTLWHEVQIGVDTTIEGSVICSNVTIGEGARLEKGVVVAQNCLISDGAVLKESVKVWPNKEIESHSIVSSNVIWGERWKRSLFEESKVRGLANFELTPEFAAKLGAAFGTFMPKGSSVLMGRDTYRAPRMIKRAFVAGALSAGVNVDDLKEVPIPVLRYKLATGEEAGGAYFRFSLDNPEITEILFYDSSGIETSAAFEKSFERVFQREDFRRVTENAVGRIMELRGVIDLYNEAFLKTIDKDKVKEKDFRIIVDFSFGAASEYFPAILNDLGCEVISLNGYTKHYERTVDFTRGPALLSEIVKATDATAAFRLDPWGQRVYFVDETGAVYEDMDSLFLIFHLFLKAEQPGTLAVPLFVPSYIEKVAEEHGFRVKRTKNSVRAVSEAAKDDDISLLSYPDGRFVFADFHNAFDGMFTLAKTLEMMATLDLSLSEIAKEIPDINFLHTTIPCPWESKGQVMRRASEEAMDKNATFLDGVKISMNGSWVLIFPDQYKSIIHLYAEGNSKKRAEALIDEYTAKIGGWVST